MLFGQHKADWSHFRQGLVQIMNKNDPFILLLDPQALLLWGCYPIVWKKSCGSAVKVLSGGLSMPLGLWHICGHGLWSHLQVSWAWMHPCTPWVMDIISKDIIACNFVNNGPIFYLLSQLESSQFPLHSCSICRCVHCPWHLQMHPQPMLSADVHSKVFLDLSKAQCPWLHPGETSTTTSTLSWRGSMTISLHPWTLDLGSTLHWMHPRTLSGPPTPFTLTQNQPLRWP